MKWVLSLIAFFLVACQSKQVGDRGLKPRSLMDPLAGDHQYEKTFDRNSKMGRTHTELMPGMLARVTFWNDEMRRSFVREKAGRLRLTEEEEAQLAKEELQENEAFAVFILNVATREPEWNDFDQKRSNWRLSIEDPTSTVKVYPERIETISTKDDQARYFYQNEESFMQLYKVRFPRESLRSLSELVLHISGVRGSLQFAFENDLKGENP